MHSLLKYRFRKLKRSALAHLALLSRHFDPLLKSDTPLVTMEYRGSVDTRSLIVFLPGIGDVVEDFERRGFIDDLRRHGITADAVAVDAHYGYYASRGIHTRITEDVVATARSAGYERIWLAGISLGGFGAVSYASLYPSHINGLLLFAPYLGDATLVREIAAAGGVMNWEPGTIRDNDYSRSLWAWFKTGLSGRDEQLPIYLGYGNGDMFASANALLAELLPPDRVFSIPGGHDWHTWRQLWQAILPEWSERNARGTQNTRNTALR